MKQLFLLAFFSFAVFGFVNAQNCTPDQAYADSTVGVYPRPYEADLNPNGGITKCAFIGESFEFQFTVVLGDTLTVGAFSFPLDSISITQVEGLPAGLAYACNPTTCRIKKNSLGCALIYGTPTTGNTPGAYELKIKGSAFINGSPLPLPLEFPNPALAPGKYTLYLIGPGSDPCQFTSTSELEKQVRIATVPNPSTGFTNVLIDSDVSGYFNFRVTDLLGKTVEQQKVQLLNGHNRLSFDGSHLPNGIYLLSLQNEQGFVSQKLSILK